MQNLQEINIISVVVRIFLAMFIGGFIGFERGINNRPAGFKTYMLVCLGACMVMMTGQYISGLYPDSDPARLGAQVISGIGFLGAGSIIITGHSQIRGITTAASLWVAACLGLTIGIGFYAGAIAGGLAVIIVMTGLRNVDRRIKSRAHAMRMYIEADKYETIGILLRTIKSRHIFLKDIDLLSGGAGKNEPPAFVLSVDFNGLHTEEKILSVIESVEGIVLVEELNN